MILLCLSRLHSIMIHQLRRGKDGVRKSDRKNQIGDKVQFGLSQNQKTEKGVTWKVEQAISMHPAQDITAAADQSEGTTIQRFFLLYTSIYICVHFCLFQPAMLLIYRPFLV